MAGSHWGVDWVSTANGHGVTEGGSSGAPLFDNAGRIVGTLTGGGSFCSQVPNTDTDAYGKVSYHWTNNPNAANEKLGVWLDPGNTGTLTFDGTYFPCTPATSNDAGIESIIVPNNAVCNDSIAPIVVLQNFGGTILTSATIDYGINGGASDTYNWTGSLSINQSEVLFLPGLPAIPGQGSFTVSVSNPNGNNDDDPSNDSQTSTFNVVITDESVWIVVNTDNNGSETTWELSDNGNNVLYSGGPYDNNQRYVEELCIASGECYTFTIYDAAPGNGICCGSGTGSYSVGSSDFVGFWTGGEFGDMETTEFCISEPGSLNCDTLVNELFDNGSPVVYTVQSGGYVSGPNGFGDLAKAQEFEVNVPVEITGVVLWIAFKNHSSGDANSSININIWEMNGPGTINGGTTNNAPGNILASETLPLSRIDTSGFLTFVEFSTPVTVVSNYAIGAEFNSLVADDNIAIVSSTDGDAQETELAWEMWSDGEWHSILEGWNNLINGDIDLGIFPIVCDATITTLNEEPGSKVKIYPNPATTNLFISINESTKSRMEIQVFDAIGRSVLRQVQMPTDTTILDLRKLKNGIYIIEIRIDGRVHQEKVLISK